ncbi:sigma-70 family RNA polymerase sigma factor [Cellulosilyticum sp. I15G10I2]|uniref:sigma-70 family RNA polymerase sigma factor n=1 Tax=Cellulosilyticum sp. I15G10I2 TaxID=1892843 RepID=UPI00085C0BBC|nr:sigma-70 family RNA polymerase sigma factor [Cellulosilyticum sp. I15G10I2]
MATDNEIIELLRTKKDKGLECMMDTYMGLVYSIVHNKIATICSKEDIEECVSDVFYELYRNSEKIDLNKGSIKAFLALVAKRKAIDIYRKYYKQKSKVISIEDFKESELDYLSSDYKNADQDKEIRDRVIEEIKALGEPDSEMLIRKYFFEQPSKVISEAMGIKVNTIDKRISRALIKLKKVWEGGDKNVN